MTRTELKALTDRVEFHAKEASLAARKATLDAFQGARSPVDDAQIQRNVAEANCAAVHASLLLLQCHRLIDSLGEYASE